MIGATYLPALSFWTLNGLLLVVDTTGKPNFISRYRIQVGKNDPVRVAAAQPRKQALKPSLKILTAGRERPWAGCTRLPQVPTCGSPQRWGQHFRNRKSWR